jgi:hypothetical protein
VSTAARTRDSVKYLLVEPSARLSVLGLAVAPAAMPSSFASSASVKALVSGFDS